jgi:hypothetical protein
MMMEVASGRNRISPCRIFLVKSSTTLFCMYSSCRHDRRRSSSSAAAVVGGGRSLGHFASAFTPRRPPFSRGTSFPEQPAATVAPSCCPVVAPLRTSLS